MDASDLPDLSKIMPLQLQVYMVYAFVLIGMTGKLLGGLRSGGGLRRMILGAWYGENIPPIVALDYPELKKASNPKTNDTEI